MPSFERLTLTAMIEVVAALIRSLPYGAVNLIGSSMGGAVALHLADRRKDAEGKQVARLLPLGTWVLDFHANRINQLTEEGVRAWRESGWLNVFHHGEKAEKRVHYGLMEDMLTYDSFARQLRQPILIHHGRRRVSGLSSVRALRREAPECGLAPCRIGPSTARSSRYNLVRGDPPSTFSL